MQIIKCWSQPSTEREDAENDRTTSMPLVGRKVKGVYENGVFVGSISYFNTQLQEYLVKFDDGSEDYICEDDIDGVELILM